MNQISKISETKPFTQIQVLTDEEVDHVSGGNPVLGIAAAATAAFAALSAAEGFGEKVGKALYNALH